MMEVARLFLDKHKTHKYDVGRAHSCWMLNCILLALTVLSSLYRSLTLSLSVPVSFFPTISALLTAMQNRYTRLSTN
jgi:hypothetical protein